MSLQSAIANCMNTTISHENITVTITEAFYGNTPGH